jgi:hypothetical protein
MLGLLLLTPRIAACSAHLRPASARGPISEGDLPARPHARLDVDRDGLEDRVYPFPSLTPPRPGPDDLVMRLDDLPPAIVAHALPDGRFTFDDPVARAALRALCPEAPPTRAWNTEDASPDAVTRAPYLEALLLDGFCRRVWGDSVEAAVAHVRATIAASHPSRFAPGAAEALAAAIEALFVPLRLGPMTPAVWPVWPARPAPSPRVPGPVPSPECAAVTASWEAIALRVMRETGRIAPQDGDLPVDVDLPYIPCRETPQGRWALRPGDVSVTPGDEAHDTRISIAAALVWEATDAVPGARPELRMAWEAAELNETFASIAAAADLDGDGTPEVFLSQEEWYFEADDYEHVSVLTIRDGTIVPYAPSGVAASGRYTADIDRDGRPDLVLSSPWTFHDRCGMNGIPHRGPEPALHALPDGGFSRDDAAVRAWLRSQCFAPEPDEPPDVLEIACARLAGVDPEAIVAALHADGRLSSGPQRLLDEDEQTRCLTFQQLAAQSVIGFARR